MSWTKRQFVQQAFDELGYASYAYSLPEEQLLQSKHRLDSMLATWNGMGIVFGYPLQSTQVSDDFDEPTDIPDYAFEAIYTNLALRISSSIGKAVPTWLAKTARESYKALLFRTQRPAEQQFPETLPLGSGNKTWIYNSPYFRAPAENLEIFDGDGTVEF